MERRTAGRWDGDTLVVESRDFPDRPHYRWNNTWRIPTSRLHLVERFTRVDAETIDYEATITDSTRFTRPWTVRFPLSQDQSARGVAAGELFEFACHEGNYASKCSLALCSDLEGRRSSSRTRPGAHRGSPGNVAASNV